MNFKEIFKITGIPVLIASLCCVTPLVLFLLGISTVSFASSLSDKLYGQYKWLFRGIGFIALIVSLIVYFRSIGICTLDQIKRKRNKVINIILVVFIVSIIGYIVWLYVIVEYIGKLAGIWG